MWILSLPQTLRSSLGALGRGPEQQLHAGHVTTGGHGRHGLIRRSPPHQSRKTSTLGSQGHHDTSHSR